MNGLAAIMFTIFENKEKVCHKATMPIKKFSLCSLRLRG